MNTLQRMLRRLGACNDAVEWLKDYNNPVVAWLHCPRGDWLLWLAAHLGVDREALVRGACACARLVLKYTEDERPRLAIQMAEQWAGGIPRPSLEQVKDAARGAYIAAQIAYATYYETNTSSAACTAAATYACYAASYSAESVYYAYESALYAAAAYPPEIRTNALEKFAYIMRDTIDIANISELWWELVLQRELQESV